jgi:nitrite reductase (NADH) large subunit
MKHIVIIGNSSAGTSAAEAVRKKDTTVAITVISDEQYPAYNRSLLADVLSGKLKERDVFFRKKEFYDALGITLLLGKRIEKIVPEKNTLVLGDKTKIGYDGLIIATGVSPRVPKELKGGSKHGVIGLRSM